LSDKTCRSTWKWSDEQDNWRCIWFIFIADWASAHWSDNKIDAHTETDQINMKNSLKREIQCSSFSISDIKDDTSTSVTAQKLCKVSQRIINAAMHEKNWLQSISTWKMKSRMKSNATRREHHELEKAFRNHERSDNDHLNDTLNEHTESISSCDVIKESDERERK